jgi:lipid-A-disaccharide synthase
MQNINKRPKIFISAGETSGDLLGANLARALLQKNPQLILTGMGGQQMQNAGVSIKFNAEKLAVVGITEVLTHLPSILSTWHAIKKYLAETKPDLVILIDFPDTHFRIMKAAKKLNIPVLYYVSPQIWAWRAGRIKQIQQYVDHMAVLFSFEEKIYQLAKVPVTFVGHPLGDLVKPSMTKSDAYHFFQFNADQPIVTLFPGSRRSEIQNHLSIMIESVKKIVSEKPNTQFALMLANHFDAEKMRAQLPAEIKIIQNNMYDLLQITDAAIAVSGTVTLEIALMQVPLCIIYKMKPFTHWIAKKLIHIEHIGLCNIVAEKRIAKELIQDDVNSAVISAEILKLLNDKNYREKMKNEFQPLKKNISVEHQNSSGIVANIAMQLIGAV